VESHLSDAIRDLVREIAATARALRLYPPSSPIPRESADKATRALERCLDEAPVLTLDVVRAGFRFGAEEIGVAGMGAADLSSALQSHGVAEVTFTQGCSAPELAGFLAVAIKPTEEVVSAGGFSALLVSSGVECIRVSDVKLTTVDGASMEVEGDVDDFLRELSGDADRLSSWLSAASAGDPAALEGSLMELARVAGGDGRASMLDALARAFMAQEPGGRDALLGLALGDGESKDLLEQVFPYLTNQDIADSVCKGMYGDNMLSLSSAVSGLPIGDRFSAVVSQVKELLPQTGHTEKEVSFLQHMLDVRQTDEPEDSLVQIDPAYGQMVEMATVQAEEITTALSEVEGSAKTVHERSITTLLSLLDQQRDFALYTQTLDRLATTVPRLLETGDLLLAKTILVDLARREAGTDLPWPELAMRLRDAIARATNREAMTYVVNAVLADRSRMPVAKDIVRCAGETASNALIEGALAVREGDGLSVAEEILGRRMASVLPDLASSVQWYQIAALSRGLRDIGDQRALESLRSLAKRPDAQSRREVASGLAGCESPVVFVVLASLLSDESADVAIAAARSVARCSVPGAAQAVVDRLEGLDLDEKDYLLGRELIGALSRMPDRVAFRALKKLSRRKALRKRGHFAEVQELVHRALAEQEKGGSRR
jgi:hypothetical protein